MSANDTQYLFPSEKYDVVLSYSHSNFYAPDFYFVRVSDKAGNEIWNGGDSVFLDSLFSNPFISDSYNKLIVNKVFDSSDSHSQQITCINLLNGEESALTEKGYFGIYGHFQSFDAAFYQEENVIHVVDFLHQKKYTLHALLNSCFNDVLTWGVCSVTDCILVCSSALTENLSLFDLKKETVLSTCSLPLEVADSRHISIQKNIVNNEIQISISYANKDKNGILNHKETQYFSLIV